MAAGTLAGTSGSGGPRISVVVPVYNGAATLAELVARCHEVLDECASAHELVLVNDGSQDDSWAEIERLAADDPSVRGIDLARNYGQHNALLAGIRAARYELTITLDDDLQNPPEEIPVLLAALTPDCDVVYGEPIAKRQRLDRRLATNLVVWALHVLGGRTAPMVSAFRLFRTELRDGFADYTGPDVSVDALLTWRTERFTAVPVHHSTRAHGSSNYSLLKLARHALTMITAFSTRPLQMASGLGFLVILFGVVVFGYVVVRFAVEGGSVPGFPFLASIISIFSGAQLFAIGVIGEYLARVHVRVMSRPSYRVRGTTGAAAATATADPPATILDWDSEFWGFPVARVEGERVDAAAARRAAAWCDANGVRCAFVLAAADDAASAAALEAADFRAVDTRITLERRPGPGDRRPGPSPALAIRAATEFDREALEALGAQAHTDARFFFDTRFPAARAADLYRAWATRGLTEPERELFVAETGGEVVGYLQLTDSPAIDLIAVAERARGQGVGSALVAAAVERSGDRALRVVTQARNVQAMRLYESAGFRQVRAEVWYHRWA